MEVSNSLQELQAVELSILKTFIEICKKNNLRYFIIDGTLLGAVRHNGFIPWDDDIDIGMPREDFEKFSQLVHHELTNRYQFISINTNSSYTNPVPRIIDTSVTLMERSAMKEHTQNAWIDIFPMDGMPSSKIESVFHKFRLLSSRLKFNYARFSTNVDLIRKNRPWIERILINIGKRLPVEKIFSWEKEYKRMEKLLRKYPYDNSKYIVNFYSAYKFREMFDKKYYGNGKGYKFEDIILSGPVDYHFILTSIYGDYLTPPSEDDRNHHNTEILTK